MDQFTKQAEGFSKGTPLRDADALASIVRLSQVCETDSVVDLGCGPGIVSAAMAASAKSVVGLDLNAAMLQLAQAEAAGANVAEKCTFREGDVYSTGLADKSADIVVSRFVLHHLERPVDFLRECRRVARKRVVLVDVSPDSGKTAALNALETLRDSSHVAFYSQPRIFELFKEAGFSPPDTQFEVEGYRVPSAISDYLARSFFASDEARAGFEAMLAADIKDGSDSLDLRLTPQSWSHPVSIIVASRQ